MITTREEYEELLSRGIDALYNERGGILDNALRRELQREKFGKNDALGNSKFYKYCIKNRPMVCEHCGRPIRNPSAVNVSHILSKKEFPEGSHDARNINILCFGCHTRWEYRTTRASMNPWFLEKNERTITKLKNEYGNNQNR